MIPKAAKVIYKKVEVVRWETVYVCPNCEKEINKKEVEASKDNIICKCGQEIISRRLYK